MNILSAAKQRQDHVKMSEASWLSHSPLLFLEFFHRSTTSCGKSPVAFHWQKTISDPPSASWKR